MKKEKTVIYSIGKAVGWMYFRLFCGVKMLGRENFPKDEHFIVMANHICALDPVLLGVAYSGSEIHFMAKDSLFRNPLMKWVAEKVHAIPVRRGETDMAAMRSAMQVLREEKVLGIFPEGTRHRDGKMGEIQTGIAVLALKQNVSLIPVGISGHYRPFGKLKISVGRPIDLDDLRALRPDAETMAQVVERIREGIQKQM